jgi:hypothetical protein
MARIGPEVVLDIVETAQVRAFGRQEIRPDPLRHAFERTLACF